MGLNKISAMVCYTDFIAVSGTFLKMRMIKILNVNVIPYTMAFRFKMAGGPCEMSRTRGEDQLLL